MFARLAAAALALAFASAPAVAQEYFGIGSVQGDSDTKNAGGDPTPPWTRGKVDGSVYHKADTNPIAGEVTLVPHDPALAAVTVKIEKVRPRSTQACTETSSYMWGLDVPAIADPAWLGALAKDKDGRLVVLFAHPPKPKAKAVPIAAVKAADLPRGYPLQTLQHAFDLDGAGKVDLVQLAYCCGRPQLLGRRCPEGNMCWGMFRRGPQGWRRIFEEEQC
jgi:hypothetical protein